MMMIPLVPSLALAFLSFVSSAFVILRIVIPILPPHPLSRRVSPSEFGLPNFRSLSPADKSHIWLASCDILALAIFIWEVINEYLGGPAGYAVVDSPASSVRLWIATTLRQSCLLIVAALTLLHVRMAHPISFGAKHWMLWAPTLLLALTSTALAGVLAGAGVQSFYWGLLGYSTSVAVLSSIAFVCLIATLVIIKRNLASLNDIREPWPPADLSEKPRPSFATEDIEVLKDGSSWITSRASSRHDSISAFSFSTHHTHSRMPSNASSRLNLHPAGASHPSIPTKSSFWFNPATSFNGGRSESPVPPVPPLPAPYRPSTPTFNVHDDPDPFRRSDPRPRMGSQSSWLTEPSVYQPTLSAWSFPASRPGTPNLYPGAYPSTPDLPNTELLHADRLQSSTAVGSRPHASAMSSADVLGGYGYSPEAAKAENGAPAMASVPTGELDISVYRAAGWLVTIWLPFALALPYYLTVSSTTSQVASMLFTLSITLSSPLLALNILLRSPLPIPSGLFDSPADPPSVVMRAPSPLSLAPSYAHSYKRSGSVTVVEGRRSGDVWISNGDAVEGKSKFGRAVGLLQPKPKLAVLPSGCEYYGPPLTPPLPIQDPEAEEHERTVPSTPQSVNNAELGVGMHHPEVLAKEDRGDDDNHVEMGMRKKDSKASSYWSGTDENVAFATKIMVAQKHYSTLAMTMVLPPSPQRRGSQEVNPGAQTAATTTAVAAGAESAAGKRASGSNHLRARSVSSMSPISAPPSSPLPPTPPTIKTMLKLTAAQSYRARTTSQASGGNPHNHNRGHGKLTHRRSYSSISSFPDLGLSEPAAELGGFINHHNNDYSFGPIDHDSLNEIDALSAGLLPLLVPGLKVGGEMRITESWKKAPSTTTTRFGNYQMGGRRNLGADAEVPEELGGMVSSDFESPQMHSTPHTRKANTQTPRTKKTSAHKRHHFSLPSLSLGKDGIHALSTWRNDLNKALETKGTSTSQYSAVPTLNVASDDVSSDRRNTVLGSDFISQLHLNAVREDDELAFSSRPAAAAAVVVVDHRYSTGFKSDTLDVPEGISTARNSMATLISALDQELNMPPGASASVPTVWQGVVPSSAASDVTLFEFNPSVEGLAESTPYDSNKVLPMGGSGRSRSGEDRAPPPVPEIPKAVKASRRSSIVYIKSDSTTATTGPIITGTSSSLSNKNNNDTSLVVSPKGGLAGWSSRAVAPLMPKSKASKLQLKASKMSRRSENDPDSAQAEAAPAVRELRMGGLRPLSLLQDRQNTANAAAAGGGVETRPLKLGKGSSKSSRASARSSDENEPPRTRESSFKKSLRPLKLARNETTKQRAVLREREVLPDVVVRPPSNGHHVGYAYDFRS